MSPLLAVALVCASLTPYQDCSRDTAVDVIVGPAKTPMDCAMQGQTTIAGGRLAEGGYLKVVCERNKRYAQAN